MESFQWKKVSKYSCFLFLTGSKVQSHWFTYWLMVKVEFLVTKWVTKTKFSTYIRIWIYPQFPGMSIHYCNKQYTCYTMIAYCTSSNRGAPFQKEWFLIGNSWCYGFDMVWFSITDVFVLYLLVALSFVSISLIHFVVHFWLALHLKVLFVEYCLAYNFLIQSKTWFAYK